MRGDILNPYIKNINVKNQYYHIKKDTIKLQIVTKNHYLCKLIESIHFSGIHCLLNHLHRTPFMSIMGILS